MKTAVSYIRFSDSKQIGNSSVFRQTDMLMDWLKQNPDFELYKQKYCDLALSGYHGKHLENGFGQLLLAVEEGRIPNNAYLVCEAWDRIGRLESFEMLNLIQTLINKGLTIVTLQDNMIYDANTLRAGTGQLFGLIAKIEQAHLYSKNLSERIKKSWVKKRKDAESGNGVKMFTPTWLTSTGALKSEHHSDAVNVMFNLYLQGKGQVIIARTIREQFSDIYPKILPKTVKATLSNKMVIGYWEDIPNCVESILDESLFYQVQKLIHQRSFQPKVTPRGHKYAGILKCACCDNNLSFGWSRPQQYSRCNLRNRTGQCSNAGQIPYTVFEWIYHKLFEEIKVLLNQHEQKINKGDESLQVQHDLRESKKKRSELKDILLKSPSLAIAELIATLENKISDLDFKSQQLKPSPFDGDFYFKKDLIDFDDTEKVIGMLKLVGFKILQNGHKVTVSTEDNLYEYTYHKSKSKQQYTKQFYLLTDELMKVTHLIAKDK
jgi:DNA invertase Pin-like site-specific DNA recombinase